MPRLFLSGYPHVCAVRTRACFVLVFLDSPFRFRCSYGSVPARRRSLPKTQPVRVRGFGAGFRPVPIGSCRSSVRARKPIRSVSVSSVRVSVLSPSVRASRHSAPESPAGPCPCLRRMFPSGPRSAPIRRRSLPKALPAVPAGPWRSPIRPWLPSTTAV